MECRNCGLDLKKSEEVCPICQTPINNVTNNSGVNVDSENQVNSGFDHYKETEKINEELGFKNMLIFSVVELMCCNQLFGLGELLILFLKFKPAVETRNLEAAKDAKKIVNVVLISGVIISILLTILNVLLTILSEL